MRKIKTRTIDRTGDTMALMPVKDIDKAIRTKMYLAYDSKTNEQIQGKVPEEVDEVTLHRPIVGG